MLLTKVPYILCYSNVASVCVLTCCILIGRFADMGCGILAPHFFHSPSSGTRWSSFWKVRGGKREREREAGVGKTRWRDPGSERSESTGEEETHLWRERERTQGEEQSGRNERGCKWGRRERGSSKHPALLTGEPAGQIACETEALMVAGSSFFAPLSPSPPSPSRFLSAEQQREPERPFSRHRWYCSLQFSSNPGLEIARLS